MKFRLSYTGPLKSSNSKDIAHVHAIRLALHLQMKLLWQRPAMSETFKLYAGDRPQHKNGSVLPNLREKVGQFQFLPLVSEKLDLLASLEVLLLLPSSTGRGIRYSGDLDNRLKTLFDALRVPVEKEIPASWQPQPAQKPLYCLLRDDRLVTAFSVASDQLLEEGRGAHHVHCIIHVVVDTSKFLLSNQDFML